jgi:integration host factor subunit beta
MTKRDLIDEVVKLFPRFSRRDAEVIVNEVFESLTQALVRGERIEIRGFGSFSLHFRPPRQGRNPKTGEAVALSGKHVPHFKPGKDLRERVNDGADHPIRD